MADPLDHSADRDNARSFDQEWEKYAEELADLPEPELDTRGGGSLPSRGNPRSAQHSSPSASNSSSSSSTSAPHRGPRDWHAPDEDGDHLSPEDLEDLELTDQTPAHVSTLARWLWCIAGLTLALSLLFALSVLPGGGLVAGVSGLAAFVCAAWAAFASAPRHSSTDPYRTDPYSADDGL